MHVYLYVFLSTYKRVCIVIFEYTIAILKENLKVKKRSLRKQQQKTQKIDN